MASKKDMSKIEKFDGSKFRFWKMQTEDLLFQKDLYLPLSGKKPEKLENFEYELLDRKALGTIRLTL